MTIGLSQHARFVFEASAHPEVNEVIAPSCHWEVFFLFFAAVDRSRNHSLLSKHDFVLLLTQGRKASSFRFLALAPVLFVRLWEAKGCQFSNEEQKRHICCGFGRRAPWRPQKNNLPTFIRAIKRPHSLLGQKVKGGIIIIIIIWVNRICRLFRNLLEWKVDHLEANTRHPMVGSTTGNIELRIHSAQEAKRALLLYLWYLRPWKGGTRRS